MKKSLDSLQSLFLEGEKLYAKGQYEKAGEIYMSFTEIKAYAPMAYYRLAAISNISKDPVTAKNLYYKAFKLQPDICRNFLSESHPNKNYVYKGRKREETLDACPLCKESTGTPYWCYSVIENGTDYVQAYNPVRLWMHCEDCHHLYAEEFPSQHTAASTSFQFAGEAMPTKPHLLHYYSGIVSNLVKFTEGEELLEIGIGGSEFALVAQEMGFNVFGLDVSEGNVCQALKLGINAKVQDILKFETTDRYDVVIIGDVIEHVADPVETMEKISNLLKEKGVLWISTPNFEAAFSRLAGHNDPMRREAAHKNYFSRVSLISLLERFKLIPVDYKISGHYNGSMEIIAIKD